MKDDIKVYSITRTDNGAKMLLFRSSEGQKRIAIPQEFEAKALAIGKAFVKKNSRFPESQSELFPNAKRTKRKQNSTIENRFSVNALLQEYLQSFSKTCVASTAVVMLNILNSFMDYCTENQVSEWEDVTPEFTQSYYIYLKAKGLKGSTRNYYCGCLARSARYISEKYGFPNYVSKVKFGIKAEELISEKLQATPTFQEMIDFVIWMKQNAQILFPVATVMAFSGMRLYEACGLRHSDIEERKDGNKVVLFATITTSEEREKVKNYSSKRTIPLCGILEDTIRKVWDRKKGDNYLFLSRQGQPLVSKGSNPIIAKVAHRALAEARREGIIGRQVVLTHFRKVFACEAIFEAGLQDRLADQYIGHQAPDTIGRRYLPPQPAMLVRFIEKLNEHFIERLGDSVHHFVIS